MFYRSGATFQLRWQQWSASALLMTSKVHFFVCVCFCVFFFCFPPPRFPPSNIKAVVKVKSRHFMIVLSGQTHTVPYNYIPMDKSTQYLYPASRMPGTLKKLKVLCISLPRGARLAVGATYTNSLLLVTLIKLQLPAIRGKKREAVCIEWLGAFLLPHQTQEK